MNIVYTDTPDDVIAKTCGYESSSRRVAYCFVGSCYNCYKDKRDIILTEIEACERLLKYPTTMEDIQLIEEEISELKLTLDLLH